MKRLILLSSVLCLLSSLFAAPYPVTINSRVQTAPPLTVYKSTEATFRVTFTDGATPSDVTGAQPFMVWGTNATASAYSTSSVSVVSSPTGIVDFTFSPASVNYAAGRYVYEVGIQTGSVIRVYRQGLFTIYDSLVGSLARSLYGSGTSVVWQTSINWNLVNWLNLPSFATEAYVTNRIAAALAPVAASVTNLSTTLSATTQTVASVASQVTNLSLSVAAVESILNTNRWIGIDSIPASASRIMIASKLLFTVDKTNRDIWEIVEGPRVWQCGSLYGVDSVPYPLYAPFSFYDVWTVYEENPGLWLIQFTQYPLYRGYVSDTNATQIALACVQEGQPGVLMQAVPSYVATNHIVRLASTGDVDTAIAAWMNSDAAGQWVAGAAAGAAQSAVANHTNSPTHLITGDRALIDSIPSLTAAPVWLNLTNMSGSVTLTNALEAPIYLHATGSVSIAFSGLRPPLPIYLVVRSPESVFFPTNTYFVGGGSFQTNRANHFIVWDYASGLYVTPVTTTE